MVRKAMARPGGLCLLLGVAFTAPQVAQEGLRVRVGVSYAFEEEGKRC